MGRGNFALDGGILHWQKPALRQHVSDSHAGENVGRLFWLEPVLNVPRIVINLHSNPRVKHETRTSRFDDRTGRALKRGRLLLLDHHSPLNWSTLADVILGMGM